jgi:gamma-glutamyltranspeptidase/glutathione hydrolase/leukotriene-C4 hydrolase
VRQKIFDNITFQDPGYYGARTLAKDNHGTAHISILDADGSAVAVTSTVNG